VRFEVARDGGGTRLVHATEIETKTLVVKLMTPMLRGVARRQTESIVARLRAIAEAVPA
jgi:methyl coenzyme M reductase subunit C